VVWLLQSAEVALSWATVGTATVIQNRNAIDAETLAGAGGFSLA
jgi:hypothetical protein